MKHDPFASLARAQRLRGRAARWRRALLRPLRPTRARPDRAGPPHLLLVGVDTLRADHVGCLGGRQDTTPRLDALAGGGTVFTDVTAPAPWTLPSFAGALTGLMPGLHGAYLGAAVRNMDDQPPRRLADGAVTLADHLRAQGYRTAAFYSNPFFAFGLAETFDHHRYHNLAAGDLVDLAADWLRRHADRPCCCFVLLNDPHEPTTPKADDLERFLPPDAAVERVARLARWGEPPLPHLGRADDDPGFAAILALKRAVYAAAVHEVDRAVADLQRQLTDLGLAERTVVSVFSDHGEEFREHAVEARSWDHDPRGLVGIGHGHSQFQEVLHVPWLAWGPGVPAGARVVRAVSLLDLAPTVVDWLGLPPLRPEDSPAGRRGAAADLPLVGRSLADPAASPADRLLLAEALAYGPDVVALRRGDWKLVAHRDGRPLALYDLERDPLEQRDRKAEGTEKLKEFTAELDRWRRSGLGAAADGGGDWKDHDDTVRRRLRDLGYTD